MNFIFVLFSFSAFALARSEYSAMERRWMKIFRDAGQDFSPLLTAILIDNENGTMFIEKPITQQPTALKTTESSSTYEMRNTKLLFKKSISNEAPYKILTPNTTKTNTTPTKYLTVYTTPPQKEYIETIQTYSETTNTIPSQIESKHIMPTLLTHKETTYLIPPIENTIPTHNKTLDTTSPQKEPINNETNYILPTHNESTPTIITQSVTPIQKEFIDIMPRYEEIIDTIPTHKITIFNETIYIILRKNGTMHRIPMYEKQMLKKSLNNGFIYNTVSTQNEKAYTVPIKYVTVYTTPPNDQTTNSKLTHNEAKYTIPTQVKTLYKTPKQEVTISTKPTPKGTIFARSVYPIPTQNDSVYTILTHNETTYTVPKQNGTIYRIPIFMNRPSWRSANNKTIFLIQTHNKTIYTKPTHMETIFGKSVYPIPTQNDAVYTIPTHNETTYTVPKQNETMHRIPIFMKQPSRRPAYNKTIFSIPTNNDTKYVKPIPMETTHKLPHKRPSYNGIAHKIPELKSQAYKRLVFMRPILTNYTKLLTFL